MWKATLSTHHGGGIALTTAVKTLKAGNDTSRKELLHEAALMALLEHGNLVAILGVVTAPRNMPALLVLEYCEYGTLISYVCMTDPEYLDTSMMLTFCHDVGCGLQYLSSRRIRHCCAQRPARYYQDLQGTCPSTLALIHTIALAVFEVHECGSTYPHRIW